MAIGHLAIRSHSRAKSHTAAAGLAYRCGATLRGPDGAVHDYSRRARDDVAATGIAAPHGTPIATDLQTLADAVETAERRRDSQIGRDFQPAIPAELDEEQGIELVSQFAHALRERYGTVAVWAVHRPDRRGDVRNAHGHIWMPTRDLSEDGQLGKKLTRLQSPKTSGDEVKQIRTLWQQCANNALQRAGQHARVDTGRRRDGRPPQPTLGRECTAIERQAAAESVGDNPIPAQSVATLCAGLQTIDPDGCATESGRELAAHTAAHGRTQTPESPETLWPRRRRSVRDGTRRRRRRNRVRAPLPVASPTQAERTVEELTSALADVEQRLTAARETVSAANAVALEEFLDEQERLTAAKAAQEATTTVAPPSPPTEPVNEPIAPPTPPPAREPARSGYADIYAAQEARKTSRIEEAPSPTVEEENPTMPVHPLQDTLKNLIRPTVLTSDASPSVSNSVPDEPEAKEPSQEPQEQKQEHMTADVHDIAGARRRRGPAVSAHADTTEAETREALAYLAGDQVRPSLDRAVDQFVVSCLNGTGPETAREKMLTAQLATSVRSPESARTAARIAVAEFESLSARGWFRTKRLAQAIARWREELPRILRRIRRALVPLEVQHRRDQAKAQPQRPPGPDLSM